MSSDMTGRGGTVGNGRAGQPRPAADRCPRDPAHQAVAVSMLYASGRAQIGIALRHGPSGVRGRSVGQANAETALSAALAPPVSLPSWQRPARVAVIAGALLALLVVGAASSMSEQDIAGLKLLGTIAVIVAVAAGLTAWRRRRDQELLGAAYAAAATAWQRAMFCTQCGASWVPGDRRTIGQDRVLGRVLLHRAKTELARTQS